MSKPNHDPQDKPPAGDYTHPRMLPRIKVGNKICFLDARLRLLRNVENPHDFVDYGDDYAKVVHALEAKAAQGE